MDMQQPGSWRPADLAIDLADLVDPLAPFRVLQAEHRLVRPVEVVSDEGYLLAEAIEGVAYDSPAGMTPSTL